MRSAAIGALMKLHIPERLREAGPQVYLGHMWKYASILKQLS